MGSYKTHKKEIKINLNLLIRLGFIIFCVLFCYACKNSSKNGSRQSDFKIFEEINHKVYLSIDKDPNGAEKNIDSLSLENKNNTNSDFIFLLKAYKKIVSSEQTKEEKLAWYLTLIETPEYKKSYELVKYYIRHNIFFLLYTTTNYQDCLEHLFAELSYLEHDEEKYYKQISKTYINISYILNIYIGKGTESQKFLTKAYDISIKHKSYAVAVSALYNIGMLFLRAGDYEKAIEKAKMAIALYDTHLKNDKKLYWKSYSMILKSHLQLNQLDKVKETFEIIEKAYKEGDMDIENYIYFKAGNMDYFISMGQYDYAEKELDKIYTYTDANDLFINNVNQANFILSVVSNMRLKLPKIKNNPALEKACHIQKLSDIEREGQLKNVFIETKIASLERLIELDEKNNNSVDIIKWQHKINEINKKVIKKNKDYLNQLDSWIKKDLEIAENEIVNQKKALQSSRIKLFGLGFIIFVLFGLLWKIQKQYKTVKALKIRENFMANMSHELRTPLNAISGYSDLLQTTPLNFKQNKFLNAIIVSSDLLFKIISNILDITKLNSGELKPEKNSFRLDFILEKIVDSHQDNELPNDVKINLRIESIVPKYIMGDAKKIGQIVKGLLSNALKFTDKGEVNIYVKTHSNIMRKPRLSISVSDTGIGIHPDKLKLIFEPFMQAEISTERKFGGAGLGLSMVKGLVKLLGGSIKVNSSLNTGSTFTVEIPFEYSNNETKSDDTTDVITVDTALKKPDGVQQNPMIKYPSNSKKGITSNPFPNNLKILVVEDNITNQELAKTYLEKWNCHVTIANNGEEGVDIVKKEPFDLVLMDLQMPVMDGFKATQIMREEEQISSEVPIVALTAGFGMKDFEQKNGVIFTDCILKPYKARQLFDMLAKFFGINE